MSDNVRIKSLPSPIFGFDHWSALILSLITVIKLITFVLRCRGNIHKRTVTENIK